MMDHVYEIVDATSDEQYWPIGVCATLDDCLQALADCYNPHSVPCDDIGSESYTIEIYRRKLGYLDLYNVGTSIYTIEFTERYDEVKDEYVCDRRDYFGGEK